MWQLEPEAAWGLRSLNANLKPTEGRSGADSPVRSGPADQGVSLNFEGPASLTGPSLALGFKLLAGTTRRQQPVESPSWG